MTSLPAKTSLKPKYFEYIIVLKAKITRNQVNLTVPATLDWWGARCCRQGVWGCGRERDAKRNARGAAPSRRAVDRPSRGMWLGSPVLACLFFLVRPVGCALSLARLSTLNAWQIAIWHLAQGRSALITAACSHPIPPPPTQRPPTCIAHTHLNAVLAVPTRFAANLTSKCAIPS